VIVLIGDGGLLFTIGELAMAAELKINLPVVVINDGGYGEIRRQMMSEGINPIGVNLYMPDFPALAESFGLHGERLKSLEQLKASLTRALDRNGPSLIEIPWIPQW
jgi:acetolactate synthase-1/2/3 large subunit